MRPSKILMGKHVIKPCSQMQLATAGAVWVWVVRLIPLFCQLHDLSLLPGVPPK